MSKLNLDPRTEGQLRHVLTLAAGFLIALNVAPENAVAEAKEILLDMTAVIFTTIAFVRSYITKPKKNGNKR